MINSVIAKVFGTANDRAIKRLLPIVSQVNDLEASVRDIAPDICHFEASVFDGKYITGDITRKYLNTLERARNDAAKETQDVAIHITRNLAAHL